MEVRLRRCEVDPCSTDQDDVQLVEDDEFGEDFWMCAPHRALYCEPREP